MKPDLILRRAVIHDVPSMLELIRPYVEEGTLLPLPAFRLFERLRDFVVAEDTGTVVGCGSLVIMWHNLAEVRSLAVRKGYQGTGVGRRIVETLIREAEELGIERVFALTREPGFFNRLGFREVSRETLPHKVWKDCLHCPRFSDCDEIAVERLLPRTATPVPDVAFPEIPFDPTLILPSLVKGNPKGDG
ncbi:MAG: N-acetyltransferase [candidate division Zixibacteria bacterium]|nr:N-acetyltransferase [candidate division Zixibacteria bacterium]